MNACVLLDNTVLTNFALLNRPDLALDAWAGVCTTTAVLAEYQAGTAVRTLPPHCWQELTIVNLTAEETAVAHQLAPRLGAGERSCIAVAHCRNGILASDDADARRAAQAYNIPLTGTIGILLLAMRQKRITLAAGNQLLNTLIQMGYRAPVTSLDAFSQTP